MTVHYRPLDPSEPPSVGENFAHHTVTVSLPTVSGVWDEYEVATDEAQRVATSLFDHEPFAFTDALGRRVETNMQHRFDERVGQRFRDASSASDRFAMQYPKAVARHG